MHLRFLAAAAAAVLASCTTYHGTSSALRPLTPVVDGSVVRIPIERERKRAKSTDCGAVRLLGIGEHDCKSETSEILDRVVVGAVTVDLASGACGYIAGRSPTARVYPREVHLDRGDRLFVAGVQHVVELDASGAFIAIHLQPIAIRPPRYDGPWLDEVPWAIGETHDGVTLTRVDREGRPVLALVSPERTIDLDDAATRVTRLVGSKLVSTGKTLVDLQRGWQVRPAWYRTTSTFRVADSPASRDWLVEIDDYYVLLDRDSGKRAREGASMYPVGSSGSVLVAQRTDREAFLVFDTASRTWRELRYGACKRW